MKQKRSILAWVLILAMMLVPMVALAADGDVATAAELTAAVAAGGSYKLTADIAITETFIVTTDVTIDMNGFGIKGNPAGWAAFRVNTGGDLNLVNTGANESKIETGEGAAEPYYYEGVRINTGGKVTIGENVTIESGLGVYIVNEGSQVDVYGTIKTVHQIDENEAYAAIQGNGIAENGGTVINIYPGAVVENNISTALYIPQDGVVNVYGGTITGKASAIALKSGELNISGGLLKATGELVDPPEGWSNGINASGCTIQIESNIGYTGNVKLNITGGTLVSEHGFALYEYLADNTIPPTAASAVESIEISGGVFFGAPGLENVFAISEELSVKNVMDIDAGVELHNAKYGGTDVGAEVDAVYTIVIPSKVDFGSLAKGTGIKTEEFVVEVKDAVLDSGSKIKVTVTSDFKMMTADGAELAYALNNSTDEVASGGTFAIFVGNGTENGSVSVDTAFINAAGVYSDTMTFAINVE